MFAARTPVLHLLMQHTAVVLPDVARTVHPTPSMLAPAEAVPGCGGG
jgi:hypothetical protein